jgi:hypothetical protein
MHNLQDVLSALLILIGLGFIVTLPYHSNDPPFPMLFFFIAGVMLYLINRYQSMNRLEIIGLGGFIICCFFSVFEFFYYHSGGPISMACFGLSVVLLWIYYYLHVYTKPKSIKP